MNYLAFTTSMQEIYDIFGKKIPEKRVLEIIFRRIEKLPVEFMDFAIKHFEDQLEIPRNMGRYLYRDLWPEFLERHPELYARDEIACCPLCATELPGFRKIWGPAPEYECKIVRCVCGNAPNPENERVYTDAELQAAGYYTKRPFTYEQNELPPSWQLTVGLQEETPRQAHSEYMARYEDLAF